MRSKFVTRIVRENFFVLRIIASLWIVSSSWRFWLITQFWIHYIYIHFNFTFSKRWKMRNNTFLFLARIFSRDIVKYAWVSYFIIIINIFLCCGLFFFLMEINAINLLVTCNLREIKILALRLVKCNLQQYLAPREFIHFGLKQAAAVQLLRSYINSNCVIQ